MKKSTSRKPSRTNWAKIDARRDDEIDFSDIPEQGKAFLDMLRARMSGAEALRRRFGEEGEVAVRSVFKITLVFLPLS